MNEGKVILYMYAAVCIIIGLGLIAGGVKGAKILIGAGVSFLVVGISLIVLVAYLPIQDIPEQTK